MSEKVKGRLAPAAEVIAPGYIEDRAYWPPPASLEDLPPFEKLRHHRRKKYEIKRPPRLRSGKSK